MTTDRDDPRLTAFALGGLGRDEQRAFEQKIEGNREAWAEIERIRETAALLEEGLGKGAPQTLGAERHAAIERAVNDESEESQVPTSEPTDDANQPPTPPNDQVVRLKRSGRWGVLLVGGGVAALAASTLLFVSTAQRDHIEAVNLANADGNEEWYPSGTASAAPAGPMALESEDKSKGYPGRPRGRYGAPKRRLVGGDETAHDDSDRQGEGYTDLPENPFVLVSKDPRSTFSVDVDTASYSLIRRHLTNGNLPPSGAVRIEEMVNYFEYDYPEPAADAPFSVTTEVSAAPWAPNHQLVRIGIKGKHVAAEQRPNANLVFLLDVSGSMNTSNKLPLLKQGFRLLVDQLDRDDRVSIVVYAGASGLVLPPTPGDQKSKILSALNRLEAGGSTNGGQGIELAYAQARESFINGGVNRVILATDGDFNVGTTDQDELKQLIQRKAKSGVFLSVLGFGSGNYQDDTLESLADKGNGNYAYIDSAAEARKVLVEQASGTIITIAKDVKVQLEMNPTHVTAFRLIGYENRVLAHQDFKDDTKDAGEIGADHTVTALYEIVPKGQTVPDAASNDPLRYQEPEPRPTRTRPTNAAGSNELMTIKLRYKTPTGSTSREVEVQVENRTRAFRGASRDHQFAAAVAAFGMVLRGSSHRGSATYDSTLNMARRSAGNDKYRTEFVSLVERAGALAE